MPRTYAQTEIGGVTDRSRLMSGLIRAGIYSHLLKGASIGGIGAFSSILFFI